MSVKQRVCCLKIIEEQKKKELNDRQSTNEITTRPS